MSPVPETSTHDTVNLIKTVLDNIYAAMQFMQHQADATLSQAAAAQNTWYTILDTVVNARIYSIAVMMGTADETLEVRVTIDGQPLATVGVNCTAAAWYIVRRSPSLATLALLAVTGAESENSFLLEGKSVKIEARKTTAAGANTLSGRAKYAILA